MATSENDTGLDDRLGHGLDSHLDHRGERRLSGKESAVWYAIAAISYIALGTWQKVLLTWFIGPMWLVATLTFGPRIYDRFRGAQGQTK